MATARELTRESSTRDERELGLAVGLDVFSVVLFVAIGRREHDQSGAFAAVLETAAPFLIGLAVAWMLTRAWRRPTKVITGIVIWPVTVLVGMLVRNLVLDRGTATAFVIVTTAFLGACFVGWRAVLRVITMRRRTRGAIRA